MNRIIKFRAWDKESSIWCEPTLLSMNLRGKLFWKDSGELFTGEAELMQFTGLLDKNGKEIYEGDIVKMDSWNPPLSQIKFIEGAFCLAFLGGKYDGEFAGDIHYIHHAEIPQATVVGNIFESPELLEKARLE